MNEDPVGLIPIPNTLELLIEWGFSEEIQIVFLNAGIELDKFLNLGLTALQEFVEDSKERLRLITCIFKYKRAAIIKKNTDSNNNPVHAPSSPSRDDSDFDPDEFLNLAGDDGNISSEDEALTISKKSKNPRAGTSKENTESSEAPSPTIQSNRLQSVLSKNAFIDLNLEQFLRSGTSSSAVLIGNINGVLTNDNRKTLVKVLAEYILNKTTSPTIDDFLTLRGKIYNLFPNEPEGLYYVAPKEEGSHQSLARGKLFDRVRNSISKLIAKGVIKPRRRRSTALVDESSQLNTSDEAELSTETKAAIVVLKRSRELTSEVEEKWKLSAAFRLKELYKNEKSANLERRKRKLPKKNNAENVQPDRVVNYFNEYKILRQPRGYTLLLLDFKHLHETESENLFALWPEVQRKLQHIACSSVIEDPVGVELVNQLKADDGHLLDPDARDAILLQLLPSLCPPTARVTVGTKCFKPSIAEARNAFICHTTVAADLEPLIARQRVRMSTLKAPLQPFMIFLGPSITTITAVYVVVDNVLYKLGSTLECLDTCFKIFHSLCVGYPGEASHLWHILHLDVFKVSHNPAIDGDVPMSSRTFIAKLRSAV